MEVIYTGSAPEAPRKQIVDTGHRRMTRTAVLAVDFSSGAVAHERFVRRVGAVFRAAALPIQDNS